MFRVSCTDIRWQTVEKNRQNRNKWMQEKMFIKSDFDPTKAAEKSPPLI